MGDETILATAGVAFAAFAVWLAVRIVNRRERWAKWTLIALIAFPMLYVASFGPACWWFYKRVPGFRGDYHVAPKLYWPVCYVAMHGPEFSRTAINWYATLRSDGPIDPPDASMDIRFEAP